MAMDRSTVNKLRVLLDEVDSLCIEFLAEIDTQQRWDHEERKYVTESVDYLTTGSKTTGALRRRSLDLTRLLADMRKP